MPLRLSASNRVTKRPWEGVARGRRTSIAGRRRLGCNRRALRYLTPLERVTLALKDPPIHRRGDGRCGSAFQHGDRCRLRDITACHHLSGIRKSGFHSSLLATPSPERVGGEEQPPAPRMSLWQLIDGSCFLLVCYRGGLIFSRRSTGLQGRGRPGRTTSLQPGTTRAGWRLADGLTAAARPFVLHAALIPRLHVH